MKHERRALAFFVALGVAAFFGSRFLYGVLAQYERAHGPGGGLRLETQRAVFSYRARDGVLFVARSDGSAARRFDLVVAREGLRVPAKMKHPDTHEPGKIQGVIDADVLGLGALRLTITSAREADSVTLSLARDDGLAELPSLRIETKSTEPFVPTHGVIADAAIESTRALLLLDDPSCTVALTSTSAQAIVASVDEAGAEGLDVSSTSSEATTITVSAREDEAFSRVFAALGEPTAQVSGAVSGTTGGARVVGQSDEGAVLVGFRTGSDGSFSVTVPRNVTRWYATVVDGRAAASAPTYFEPGTGYALALDVSEGGELEAKVIDPDTRAPLTARLLVHGVEGTLDPSFGPDYRASGAGPIIDALTGSVTTPLPKGRYRVAATKGIEWSIDATTVDISPGNRVSVELRPRHVLPTKGIVGCDLHVHARPSFDTPVSVEDRVLSLVAAGVDFAVPSEHNIVGDYGPALDAQGLTSALASVHGVEVTTYSPRFGHFGVYPFPLGKPVPPFRGTTVDKLFAAVRQGGDETRILQVNHPRLPKQIGYFETSGYRAGGPIPKSMRTDFDALEVYNGYDLAFPSRVDAVMSDWFSLLNAGRAIAATGSSDSHRIQYQWAGYPRTLARVGEDGDGEGEPIDTAKVIAAIKSGRSIVTSGPLIDVELGDAMPGERAAATSSALTGHVTVRAAPWVDVTSLDVVVGGKVVQTLPIASRATVLGPEEGTLEQAAARTVRLESALSVPVSPPTWVVLVARGSRPMDDVLPFMPVPPLAFTNPIWVPR